MSNSDNVEFKVREDLHLENLYRNKASNARQRGIRYLLTFEDFMKLHKRKKCMYTGLWFKASTTSGSHNPLQKTYGRIDSNIGYTKENTIVVCHFANKFKAVWEDRSSPILDLKMVTKIITSANKFTGKLKGGK